MPAIDEYRIILLTEDDFSPRWMRQIHFGIETLMRSAYQDKRFGWYWFDMLHNSIHGPYETIEGAATGLANLRGVS